MGAAEEDDVAELVEGSDGLEPKREETLGLDITLRLDDPSDVDTSIRSIDELRFASEKGLVNEREVLLGFADEKDVEKEDIEV